MFNNYLNLKALQQENQNLKKQITKLELAVKELQATAFLDKMTGCYNRNFWENYKRTKFNRQRDHQMLVVFSIDINNLKQVNDHIGYQAGDSLLQQAVKNLQKAFRSQDLIIRIGGDEFIVLCYNDKNIPNFLNSISTSVSERLSKKSHQTSLALGSALFDKDIDNTIEDTKFRADTKMKEHKKQTKANLTNAKTLTQ